jgi:hypothetical protein
LLKNVRKEYLRIFFGRGRFFLLGKPKVEMVEAKRAKATLRTAPTDFLWA